MKPEITAVEEASDFRTKAEEIKGAVEEADLADMAEVYMDVAMEEEGEIGAVDNILEW